MHRTLRLGWLLLLSACVPGVSPGEGDGRQGRAGAGSPAALVTSPRASDRVGPLLESSHPEGPLEVELDGAPARPVAEVLPRAPAREAAPTHAERAAWSADGQVFVHCHRLPALECTECRLIHRDGTAQSLESGPGCGDEAVPSATLDARLAALALTPSPLRWPLGAEVVLVVETREHEQTNAGQARAMLKLGVRRRDGGPAAWLLHVDPCEGCGTDQACAAAAHFDALALSPQGDRLAVLVHERSPQGDERLRVEQLTTRRVEQAALR